MNITAHEELKIAQDMQIEKGQVISDRIPEKTRLQAQKRQLQLSLERVLSASIQAPPKPLPVPEVAALPPISYLEHQAGIERAKLAIRRSLALRGLAKRGAARSHFLKKKSPSRNRKYKNSPKSPT